jgi:Ca2+-binding RTX toxin-like protein
MATSNATRGGVSVRQVAIPAPAAERGAFLRDWIARNRMRLSLGLGSLLLVLPLAATAATEARHVAVGEIEGVASARLLEDGSLRVTMEDGRVLKIAAEHLRIGPDGGIAVSEAAVAALGGSADGAGMAEGAGSLGAAALGLVALAGAAGGGGGGGGEGGGGPALAVGYVIDGYVAGATVFRDLDGDRVWDEGEAFTTTGSDGSFDLGAVAGSGALVASGGIDISTGLPFVGVLTSPEGATVVTPLTTLVQAVIDAAPPGGPAPTAAEAAETVAASLGLTGDLLNDDPVAGEDLAAIKVAVQVANLMVLAEAAGADGALAVSALAEALAGGGNPLADASALTAALVAAGVDETQAADAADALAEANALIGQAEDVGGVEAVQVVLQGEVADAVAEGEPVAEIDIEAEAGAVAPLTPVVDPLPQTMNAAEAAEGLTISGSGRPGTAVTVAIGAATESATVGPEGAWSVTFAAADLPEGSSEVIVSAGPTSTEQSLGPVLVDTTPPEAPTIDVIASDDRVNGDEAAAGVTVSGTAEAGTTVTISFGGAEQSATADGSGQWSASLAAGDFPENGPATVTAFAADVAGNVGAAGSREIMIDTQGPTAALVDPVGADGVVNAAEAAAGLTLGGSAEPSSTVSVSFGSFTAEVVAGQTGLWTVTLSPGELPADGSATLEVVATDAAGNTGTSTTVAVEIDTTAPAAPSILAVTGDDLVDSDEALGGVTVSGTAEAGATVTISVGGAEQRATADGSGQWSGNFAAGDIPEDGPATVTAIATDAAGNVGAAGSREIEINTHGPAAPLVDPVGVNGVVSAAEAAAGLTLSGSAEPGSTVSVSFGSFTAEVMAGQDGLWAVTLSPGELPADGSATLEVVATDAVGNAGTSTTVAVEIDTQGPTAPLVDPVGVDSVVNAAEAAAGLTLSGSAEPGSTVSVSFGSFTAEVPVGEGGLWTVTLSPGEVPANGSATLEVVATDAAGNAGASATVAVEIDTAAPVAPSILAVSGDDVVDSDEALEGVTISGTAEAGAVVTVTLGGTEKIAVADGAGSWSVGYETGELPVDGGHSVTALATDAAGNAGAAGSREIAIYRSPPPAELSQSSIESFREMLQAGAIEGDFVSGDATEVSFVSGDQRVVVSLSGSGLTYEDLGEGPELTGGTVTAVSVTLDGEPAAMLTGLAADVAAVVLAADSTGDAGATIDALLSGDRGLHVMGTSGENELSGSSADDVIEGGGGPDYFLASGGDDAYIGDGDDQLSYADAAGPVQVDLAAGTAVKADGEDSLVGIQALRGSAHADRLTGDAADNGFRGLAGDDVIDGGAGTDRVRYDRDFGQGGGSGVIVDLGLGVAIDGFGDTDSLISIEDVDGSQFVDEVTGSDADNRIRTLEGDDDIIGSAGNDRIDGGEGYDQLFYNRLSGPIIADLAAGTVFKTGENATDTVTGIEALRGTAHADQIDGSEADEGFHGLAGDDTINGGGGWDEIRYDREMNYGGGTGGVVVDLGAGTATDSFGDTDTLIDISSVRGTAQADTLTGSDGDNSFTGHGGDDVISGGDGWDTVRYDRDDFRGGTQGVRVDLAAGTATDGFGDSDTLSGIEEVRGTIHDDELHGDANDNRLRGGDGEDDIFGSAGNDTLEGGEGRDQLFYNTMSGPVVADLDAGTVQKADGSTDFVSSFELFRGTAFDDTISGGWDNESLMGLAGNDLIDGGEGVDWVRHDRDHNYGAQQGVSVDLGAGTAIDGFGDSDTLSNIEGARGSIFADALTGSAGDNYFTGFDGDDTIDGGEGWDAVIYFPEEDDGGDRGVVVDLGAGLATDSFGSTDTLTGIEEVVGTSLADVFRGDDGDNRFEGLTGDDLFDGGGGDDEILLGEGEDSVYLYAEAVDTNEGLENFGGFDTILDFTVGAPGNGEADTLCIVPPGGQVVPGQEPTLNIITASVTDFSEATLEAALSGQTLSGDINLLYATDGSDAVLVGVVEAEGETGLYGIAMVEGVGTVSDLEATHFRLGEMDDLSSQVPQV